MRIAFGWPDGFVVSSEQGRTDQHGFEILIVKLEPKALALYSLLLHGDSCCCFCCLLNKQQKKANSKSATHSFIGWIVCGLVESMAPIHATSSYNWYLKSRPYSGCIQPTYQSLLLSCGVCWMMYFHGICWEVRCSFFSGIKFSAVLSSEQMLHGGTSSQTHGFDPFGS